MSDVDHQAERLVLYLRRLAEKASRAANEIAFDQRHPCAKVAPVVMATTTVVEAVEVLDAMRFADAHREAERWIA